MTKTITPSTPTAEQVRAALLAYVRAKQQFDLLRQIGERVASLREDSRERLDEAMQCLSSLADGCTTTGRADETFVQIFERFGAALLGENGSSGKASLAFNLRVQGESLEEVLWQILGQQDGQNVEITFNEKLELARS